MKHFHWKSKLISFSVFLRYVISLYIIISVLIIQHACIYKRYILSSLR